MHHQSSAAVQIPSLSAPASQCRTNNKPKSACNGSKRKYDDITKGSCGCKRHSWFVSVNSYVQIDELIQVAFEHQDLSPRNMSAVWHRLSRLIATPDHSRNQHRRDRRNHEYRHELNTLLARTIDGLKEYGPIELRQTALGMAKIIKQAARNCRRGGDGREANYHHRMFRDLLIGRNMERKEDLFRAIASTAVPLLPQFDPQGYSNLAYACAIADAVPRFGRSTLLEHIADDIAALRDLRTFDPQALSNIVWAYATANEGSSQSHRRLFDQAANEVVAHRDLRSFKPQELSNIVWAFATADVFHPHLFEKVADEVIAYHHLGSFNAQHLSNIVWAFATAQISDYCLFEKVAEEVAYRHLGSFNLQNISNIVWAFATAKISQPSLFKKVAVEVTTHPHWRSFKPQELANIVWAYARTKAWHPLFFDTMAEIISVQKSNFTCQNIANILWSYSTSGFVDAPLFDAMAGRVLVLLDQMNSQNLANIAWSYAVADLDAPGLFNTSFTNALLEKMDSFTTIHLNQLYQWHIWQTKELCNGGLPPVLERLCYEAFTSTASRISLFQRDVVSTLYSIGLKPKQEVLTERGFSLDALVEVNGKKVGIEVDGPSHFIGRKPTGNTKLKRRQVSYLEGISLVSVPYWEWGEVEERFKKRSYLRSLLGVK